MVRTASIDAGSAPAKKARKKTKLTRAERSDQIRDDLFRAAAEVVGSNGYLNAMINLITQKANVANGTFYNYFESQQDLFNQLLPKLGDDMLSRIAESTTSGEDFRKDERRFTAFFDYLQEHPEFYRILHEAEVFAPDAFDAHITQVTAGYAEMLRKALNAGQISGYTIRELEIVALMLMGARHYIAMRYARNGRGGEHVPKWVVRTYMKLILTGLNFVERRG